MSQKSKTEKLKYKIKDFVTPFLKEQIVKELQIDKSSYHRKVNKKIGESGGFEGCQLLIISAILNRPISELITNEAINYYVLKKTS
jgi:hypothetical protein